QQQAVAVGQRQGRKVAALPRALQLVAQCDTVLFAAAVTSLDLVPEHRSPPWIDLERSCRQTWDISYVRARSASNYWPMGSAARLARVDIGLGVSRISRAKSRAW